MMSDHGKAGANAAVSIRPQVLAYITIHLVGLVVGLNMGFSGMSMPSLRDDKDIAATDSNLGAVVTTNAIGNILGTVLALAFQEKIGYKNVILLGSVVACLGHVVAASATSIGSIQLGLALIGVMAGGTMTAGQMYNMEMGDAEHKGMLQALGGVFLNVGVFSAFLIGASFSWRGALWVESVVPILLLVRMLEFPEVPSWLVSRNKNKEAEKALIYFRGNADSARKEVEDLVEIKKKRDSSSTAGNTGFIADVKYIANTSPIRRNLMLLWAMTLTAACSGMAGTMIFGKDIYRSITGGAISDDAMTIIMGAFRIVLAVSCGLIIQALTRRALIITSGLGMAVSMAIYSFGAVGGDSPSPIIAGMALLGYDIFCTPGFFVGPFILMGELFPLRVRSTVTTLSMGLNAVFFGIGANVYIALKAGLSVSGMYAVNSLVALVGTLVIFTYLPETSGKSMAEIEAQFVEEDKEKKRN